MALKDTNTMIENNIMVSQDWKKWIFENLLLGQDPEGLVALMVQNKLDERASRAALAEVSASPYMSVTRTYQEKLHKREWLLKTLDAMRRHDESYLKPKKVPLPRFEEFLRDYYFQNKIGIFSGAIAHWEAAKWTIPDLVKKVGYDSMVEVQAGREESDDYELYKDRHKKNVKFGEFVNKITAENSSNDMYMTAYNQPFKNPALKPLLKDFDNIGDGYFDMSKFAENAFLWMGPKGVITPFHHDLTNNFFIQVVGKKIYHMIPAMQVPYMYNNKHVFSDVGFKKLDPEKFPEFSNVNIIDIELEPGDCLFIPIGWWHHVEGLTENISLTLTNMNVDNEFPHYDLNAPTHDKNFRKQINGDRVHDDSWADWTRTNLENGSDPVEILDILIKNQFCQHSIEVMMGSDFFKVMTPEDSGNNAGIVDYIKLSNLPILDNSDFVINDTAQLCVIKNFLSDKECDGLVRLINSQLRPSGISNAVEDKSFRTSTTCDLGIMHDPLIAKVDRKISRCLGVSLNYSEVMQGQKYQVGQQFKAHTDYFEPGMEEYQIYASKQGNRTWTFMIYLNEPEEGGETNFPKLGQKFTPKKGMAVAWNNLDSFGRPNSNTLHAGLPVIRGEKIVITKWFREKGEGEMFLM